MEDGQIEIRKNKKTKTIAKNLQFCCKKTKKSIIKDALFKNEKNPKQSMDCLLLSTTYSLNKRHSKICSIGYNPDTLSLVLLLHDCETNNSIKLSSTQALTFLSKLQQVLDNINIVCCSLTLYLLGHKDIKQNAEFEVLPNFHVNIKILNQKIHISFTHYENTIILMVEEFNTLKDLSNFLSVVVTYNTNHNNNIVLYFKEYVKKCKDLNVEFLSSQHYFDPSTENTHDFVKLFAEIPVFCKKQLKKELKKET